MDEETTDQTTDGQRIMGRGALVRLADGKEYELRFDFEALEIIEDEVGTLDRMVKELEAKGWKTKRIRTVATIMWAALAHYDLTRKQAVKLLRFSDMGMYLDACIVAFNRAMPAAIPGIDPNGSGTAASTGQRFTGSRRSTSRGRRKRSRG